MAQSGTAGRFVGRTTERELVERLLAEPPPRSVFVTVAGDAGIGKTRLLGEVAAAATARGYTVLTGRASQFEVALPFGLLFDALSDGTPERERADPGAAAYRALASLARSVAATGAGVTVPGGAVPGGAPAGGAPAGGVPADDPEPVLGVERHRLYRTIRELATEAAGAAGLAVLLDDVHWADESSVELLDYLIRHPPEGPVVFVLAYRSGQCPVRLALRLGRARPEPVRLTLGPLSPAEVDVWLAELSAQRRLSLYEASCGNPLYLEILAAGRGGAAGAAVLDAGCAPAVLDDRVAAALDALISAELSLLPEAERVTAQAAALVGEECEPALVACAAELPDATVVGALDALVRRGVLRQADGRIVFRHPLVRAAAYQTAGAAWRMAAHDRVARRLAAAGAGPVRQAQHLEHCARTADEETAWLLAAAAEATLDTAPATSARWFRAALRIVPVRDDNAERRAGLSLMLARALSVSGRIADSQRILHELMDGASARYRCAATELLAATERMLGRLAEARGLLAGELARLPTPGACTEATLRLELAATEILAGRFGEAGRNAAEAGRLAETEAHRGLAAAAGTLSTLARTLGGSRREAGGQLARAQWSVDGLDDAELRGVIDLVPSLVWAELLHEAYDPALRHLGRGLRVARRYGRGHVVPDLYLVRSVLHRRLGELAAAEQDAEDAEEIARAIGSEELRRFALAMRVPPLLWRHGPGAVAGILDELRAGGPLRSPWWAAEAEVALAGALVEMGEPGRALGVLTQRQGPLGAPEIPGTSSRPQGSEPVGTAEALVLAARAELLRGAVPAARDRLARARELAERDGLAGELAAVAQARAEALAAGGEIDAAVEAARSAVDQAARAQQPLREARTLVTLGVMLHRGGDPEASRHQLGAAKQRLAGCGADWLVARTTNLQRRLAAERPRSGQERPDPLSGREREVAVMVAEGLSNRDIATRLFLSPRTVESHVSRIFVKLGVSTRTAVARHVALAGG